MLGLSDVQRRKGTVYVLLAAGFYSLSTPLAKSLVGLTSPMLLAGLFYFGSGVGAGLLAVLTPKLAIIKEDSLRKVDLPWMVGSVFFGGMLAPILVLNGLRFIPASDVSLLLNFEAVFTILIAWLVFHEYVDRMFGLGAFAIILGSLIITWNGFTGSFNLTGVLAIVGGCLFWGFESNLIRKISVRNPFQVAGVRGISAGAATILLSLLFPSVWTVQWVLAGLAIGIVCYGFSTVLWVLALRYLGGARAGAYFSSAPFIGALFSVLLLREAATIFLVAAAVTMGLGALLVDRASTTR